MEHRHVQRQPVRFPVSFSGDLIDGDGVVINLTTSGCGVRTAKKVTGRSYVHVILHLPHEDKPMKVELAAIRWADGQVFGLEFIRIGSAQQRRLREYLNFLERKVTQ